MHFPYGIRTRQEGTMMLTALPLLFLLRPVSGADTFIHTMRIVARRRF